MQYLLATTLFIGTVASAFAVQLDYQVGPSSTVVANTDTENGLNILTALDPGLSSVAFQLNDGEAFSFPFFRIMTDESSVNAGEDTLHKPITASVNFSMPTVNAGINGDTFGEELTITLTTRRGTITFPSPYDTAFLKWDGPAIIDAGDRVFSVTLDDVEFNRGSGLDFDLGNGNSSLVRATVQQISSKAPDGGATALMMGSVLVGMGALRRRFLR